MSETPYATGADDELDDLDVLDTEDEIGGQMPGRPRRRFLTGWSAGALALLTCAIGFYVGVRVEKSHVSSSGTSATGALASRFAGSAKSGSSTTSRSGGFPSGSFGGGASGSGATTGTISSIDGDTLYVKETDGNTVKVKLLGDTTIRKTVTVAKGKVYPGDTVVIAGASGSGGVIDATSLTDSGASSSSSSSSSSGSTSGSSSSGSSSISSLFGS